MYHPTSSLQLCQGPHLQLATCTLMRCMTCRYEHQQASALGLDMHPRAHSKSNLPSIAVAANGCKHSHITMQSACVQIDTNSRQFQSCSKTACKQSNSQSLFIRMQSRGQLYLQVENCGNAWTSLTMSLVFTMCRPAW